MAPRNLLSLRLQETPKVSHPGGGELEAAHEERPQRSWKWRSRSCNLTSIPMLLMLGYASEESQRRHERQRDWKRRYDVLMFKIENITIVSGLLLASSCNLLIAGDLRRMTHTAVAASIFGSILSIVFSLLCRINITPGRLEFLVTRTYLFYYLYSTPSLWGGASALVFFVAVCAYTWLEESTKKYGWEARAASVIMSVLLIGNAVMCFVLGATVYGKQAEVDADAEDRPGEEQGEGQEEGIEQGPEEQNELGDNELEQRNQRPRIHSANMGETDTNTLGALAFSSFGILAWGADRQWLSSDSNSGDRDHNRDRAEQEVPSQSGTRAPTQMRLRRGTGTIDSTNEATSTRHPQRVLVRRPSKW